MYICDICGKIISDEDVKLCRDRDYVNVGLGYECIRDEIFIDNCSCGGDFVKAKQCKICGKWISANDEDICNECLRTNATIDSALQIGSECVEQIYINGFIASAFSREEIEEILTRELIEAQKLYGKIKNIAEEYCLEDEYFYSDWLANRNDT